MGSVEFDTGSEEKGAVNTSDFDISSAVAALSTTRDVKEEKAAREAEIAASEAREEREREARKSREASAFANAVAARHGGTFPVLELFG